MGEIKAELVSLQTTYASYLVYKLPEDDDLSSCVGPTYVKELGSGYWIMDDCRYIYFVSPQIPVIRSNGDDNILRNPANRLKIKGIPQQRSDGWMEVQIWEFQTGITTKTIPMHLRLERYIVPTIRGLVIQGIEFRPV
uniref:putative F-box protein PP2-B8 n=1 Tax=Erigeron canadensis TaxID=72917 RepID=UPI001CB95D9B|nr:putative F-box protein PP2-B8 [Erigeron canadensis]